MTVQGRANVDALFFMRNASLCIIHCSESNMIDQPHGNGFQLNVEAVRSSPHPGSKNGGTISGDKAHINHRRRRNSGDLLGKRRTNTSCATKNASMIKPITFGTLIKPTALAISNSDDGQHQYDRSTLAHEAAKMSGFTPEVCERIITEFTSLAAQRMQTRTLSPIKHNRMYPLRRQRSQSYTHL